jgi:hypothetical protein
MDRLRWKTNMCMGVQGVECRWSQNKLEKKKRDKQLEKGK